MNIDAPPPIAPNPPRHRVGALGVVRDAAGRVLLVLSPDRGWECPGGHVEPGEDLIAGLKREIDEETGCTVAVERLLGVYSTCSKPYYLVTIFACTYIGGDIRGSDESEDVAWFDIETARNLILPPPVHVPLDDLFATTGGPVYRAFQNGVEIRFHDGLLPPGPVIEVMAERIEDEGPHHILAASGCVRDDQGRVLLVRSEWRGWEFPGGQVEQGEDLISTLQREIEEESGVAASPGHLLGVYCTVGEPYIVQFLFTCSYTGGELRPSPETPDLAWFTPEQALSLPVRSTTRARLLDALNQEPGLAYRVYRTRPAYAALGERRFPI